METKNSLNEAQYEHIKILNKKSFKIVEEFLDMVNTINCINIKPIIEKMYGLSKYIFEEIKIIIDWDKQESTSDDKGHMNIIRYYCNDVYSIIKNPASQYKKVWKTYTKKMLRKIRNQEYRKEFTRIRTRMRNKLDKLEKEIEI